MMNKIGKASFLLINSYYKKVFVTNLKQARKQAGLTQKQLGDLVEVSPQSFSRYERGERDIPIPTLIRIAKELKVSTDWLLGVK